MTTVTKSSHPSVKRALDLVSEDKGWPIENVYEIPYDQVTHVEPANVALAHLSRLDFEDFCIGEERRQREIAGWALELTLADQLLEAFATDIDRAERQS